MDSNPQIAIKSHSDPNLTAKNVSVLLVAHGDRGSRDERERNLVLSKHANALVKSGIFRSVSHGVLKGEPTFEIALSEAADHRPAAVVIYPFFMADGYFVKSVLPQRIAEFQPPCPTHVCAPLGLNPELANLIAKSALKTARKSNIPAHNARLLIVGHGSKIGPASANATRRIATFLLKETVSTFAEIDVAFLEEAPFLADQLDNSTRPTLVSGFFNGDGLHASEDVPTAIAASSTVAVYDGPIGQSDEIADLIKSDLVRHIENLPTEV